MTMASETYEQIVERAAHRAVALMRQEDEFEPEDALKAAASYHGVMPQDVGRAIRNLRLLRRTR